MAIGKLTIYRNPQKAMVKVQKFQDVIKKVWGKGQIIVSPVCTYPAPKVGRTNWNFDLLSCLIPGNLSDATVLAIPFGKFKDGLPRSIQLMGPPGCEEGLLDIGEKFILARDTLMY